VGGLAVNTSQDAKTVRILRRGIGIVGLALPIVVTAGSLYYRRTWPGSLSGTYYTEMRNIFVGALWAVGVFLICYRIGRLDDWLGWIAGLAAILVAIFPTTPDSSTTDVSDADKWIGRIHYSSAAVLFGLLAVFCLFLFTRVDRRKRVTERKHVRNRIYRACGIVIAAAGVVALASNLLSDATYDRYKPLLICEALAVFAFGVAWLVKGETIFKDSQADLTAGDTGGAQDLTQEPATAAPS
jgi:hypothetical protein